MNVLADAADKLGLQALADLCGSQSSSFDSRVRKDKYIRYAEVVKRNNDNNELLIIMDGMVLGETSVLFGILLVSARSLNMLCFSSRSRCPRKKARDYLLRH